MMNRKNIGTLMMLFMVILTGFSACSPEDDPVSPETEIPVPNPENPSDPDNGNNNPDKVVSRYINISIGDSYFSAILEDNEAGGAFAALLPMTITMNEMNGNEKYHYLSGNLPADSSLPGTIRTGDLMLYGSNCLVLFYKTFSSSYSYTRLGRIANPDGLAAALGTGDVTVTFEVNNNQ